MRFDRISLCCRSVALYIALVDLSDNGIEDLGAKSLAESQAEFERKLHSRSGPSVPRNCSVAQQGPARLMLEQRHLYLQCLPQSDFKS